KQPIKYPVIEKVFNRHPEWKETVVIVDWTGSMYPYGAELLRWHHANISQNRIKNLIFFNDGDDFLKQRTKGVQKPIGSAGGIYIANTLQIERVIELMEEVMTNGDGGEIPENNCEAIIQAQLLFPDAPYFIMIADNQSAVRDISLLNYLKKPVHIIVCGKTESGIEPDYLTIAWYTGGSVCTIRDDLTFTQKQRSLDQTEIQFLGKVYRLVGERFQLKLIEPEKK
ncbi:MAG: hypothetical protein NZ108_04350, partial [Bacteroidia bacterium]|nr:hypothetical protein [Bacteroidia bacterium]